jgi:hypothetical protein
MKKILVLAILFSITLIGCFSPAQIQQSLFNTYGYVYEYQHKLTGQNTTGNVYTDENIKIEFGFGKTELDFELKNLTNNPIKVIWDEVSFIQFEEGKRIFHKGVKYIDRSNPQVPTIIPVGTTLSDLICPIDNVSYDAGYYYSSLAQKSAEWVTSSLWFSNDYNKLSIREGAMKLKGEKYSLLMPMEINGVKKNYTFEFEITDVKQSEPTSKPY